MEFIKLNIQLFGAYAEAKNDDLIADNNSNKAIIKVTLQEADLTEKNKTNNKSPVTITGTYTQTSGSWSQIKTPMFYIDWYDDKTKKWVNKEEKNVQSATRNVPITISKTFEVEHNDDGTLKGQARVRWVYEANSVLVPRSGEAVTKLTPLTTIPRAKTISALSAEIGYDTTITLKQTSATYTATIEYECGELKDIIAEKTTDISIGWKIPTGIYSQMLPEDKEATITLKATTFNGDTQIGSTQSTTIKAKINVEDNRPTAFLSVEDINEKTLALTNDANKVVLNASDILATFTGSTKNGATIKSISINDIDVNYSYREPDETDGTITEIATGTYTIEKPITNIFTLKVVDSRDNENKVTIDNQKTLEKIEYFIPTISNTTFFKRNTPTDGKVNLRYSGTFFNNSFQDAVPNNLEMAYAYKKKNFEEEFTEWITLTPEIIEGENKYEGEIQLLEEFDYESIYTLKVSVKDTLTELGAVYYTQDIPRGKPSHWYDDENFYVEGNYYQRNKETGKWFKPIGNLSSLKTNEKSSIVTAINELSEKNILTASLKNNYAIKSTETYEILPLVLYSKIGDKITLNSDGSITIGAGVKFIKLGASLRHRSGAVGAKYMTAYKNNNAIMQISEQRAVTTGFLSLSGNSGLIPVEENDKITLQVYGTANDSIGGGNPLVTYMTIEAIT